MNQVIVKPIISEKSFKEAEKGRYTFEVHKDANKRQIKREVEGQFKVKVVEVSTNFVKGTRVRFTRKGRNEQNLTYKKARVQLQKGDKIDIFEEKAK